MFETEEEIIQQVKAQVGALKVMMDIMTDSGILEAQAKATRKYYLDLVKEGFTKDEAMRIVCSKSILEGNFKK